MADEKVQTERENRHDHDLRAELEIKGRADEGKDREQHERDEQRGARERNIGHDGLGLVGDTLGPPQKNDRHYQINRDGGVFRGDDFAEGVGEAHGERGNQGAVDRADAADHNDDEAENQNLVPHSGKHRGDRRGDRAGESGERHARGENQGEQPRHVDSQGRRHLAIAGAGADSHAGLRSMDHEVHRAGDHQANAGDE